MNLHFSRSQSNFKGVFLKRNRSIFWVSLCQDINIFRSSVVCTVHHTSESDITPRSQGNKITQKLSWVKRHEVNITRGCSLSIKFWLHHVMHIEESEFSTFMIKYFWQNQKRIHTEPTKSYISCYSGGQKDSNHEHK